MQYIHLKVKAGEKKEFFAQKSEDRFEISVREKAERNQANTRALSVVARHFGVPENKVRANASINYFENEKMEIAQAEKHHAEVLCAEATSYDFTKSENWLGD